jgi:hypothetical protein
METLNVVQMDFNTIDYLQVVQLEIHLHRKHL